jgi:aryl sulfotransferase
MSFFHFEQSWWDARHRPNVLLVHYNDLKADLPGEMRRVADFLGIAVAPDLWPELIEAASFDAMRRNGEALIGDLAKVFRGGSSRFFHQGTNQRWRGTFRQEDLAAYDAKVAAKLTAVCARWVAEGRPDPQGG